MTLTGGCADVAGTTRQDIVNNRRAARGAAGPGQTPPGTAAKAVHSLAVCTPSTRINTLIYIYLTTHWLLASILPAIMFSRPNSIRDFSNDMFFVTALPATYF